MPAIGWSAKVHQATILKWRPTIASCLDLELQSRRSRDGYLFFMEVGLSRSCEPDAVNVTMHWKDSRSSTCHIHVFSKEQGHPESTRCWDVAVNLRRLLAPSPS
jgi:hypothetical protein